MIIINKIIPQTVELIDPNNNSMGFINEYEFNDIRIQIKKQKIEGYHCLFNGEKLFIDKDGRLFDWPKGFFRHV